MFVSGLDSIFPCLVRIGGLIGLGASHIGHLARRSSLLFLEEVVDVQRRAEVIEVTALESADL